MVIQNATKSLDTSMVDSIINACRFTVVTVIVLLLVAPIFAQQEGLIPYRKGTQWGFSDDEKKIKIEPKYENAMPFSNGRAAVQLFGKWGFINNDGKEVVPMRYDTVLPFHKGFAAVKFAGKWGFITNDGDDRIPTRYDNIWSYSDEYAVVQSKGMWGAVYEEQEIVRPQYDYISPMVDDLMVMFRSDKEGIINSDGDEVLAPNFDRVSSSVRDLFIVEEEGKCGVFRTNGREVLPVEYDKVVPITEAILLMSQGSQWGMVQDNEVLIPALYAHIFSFHGGMGSFVDSSGKWGVFNTDGQEIASAHLDNLLGSPSKLIIGFRDGKVMYWRDGKKVVGYSFDEPEEYVEGLKPKYVGALWGYVNDDDKEILPTKFEKAEPFCDEIARVRINGQDGYINAEGIEFWEN